MSSRRNNRRITSNSNTRIIMRGSQPRLRAPLELQAMQAKRTTGKPEPPSFNLTLKSSIIVSIVQSVTASTPFVLTNGIVTQNIPGNQGMGSFRINKVSAWGDIAINGTATYLAVQMPGDTSFLDANTATFQDSSKDFTHPTSVHVIPAFVQRQRWYPVDPTGTIPLFNFQMNATTAAPTIVEIHLSLEVASKPLTPSFLRISQPLPKSELNHSDSSTVVPDPIQDWTPESDT